VTATVGAAKLQTHQSEKIFQRQVRKFMRPSLDPNAKRMPAKELTELRSDAYFAE
jgi:hypothetical protein